MSEIKDVDFSVHELFEATEDSIGIGVRVGEITALINKLDFDDLDESIVLIDYKLHEGIPDDIVVFERLLSRVIIAVLKDYLHKDD
jgi:hypothetical protein